MFEISVHTRAKETGERRKTSFGMAIFYGYARLDMSRIDLEGIGNA